MRETGMIKKYKTGSFYKASFVYNRDNTLIVKVQMALLYK